MKALTLHQPWASLVAVGVKTIIDTSWPCPPSLIGQPLAIHAGLDVGFCTIGAYSIDRDVDNVWCLVDAERVWTSLPLGAVVATCRVAACVPICDTSSPASSDACVEVDGASLWLLQDVKPTTERRDITDQLPYGDFSPGRYAWLLDHVQAVDPVPARGRQRVWNWEPVILT